MLYWLTEGTLQIGFRVFGAALTAFLIAFVGGSLVPVGGHNMLEPAALGVPVLFGPHTEHFTEPAAMLEQAGGGERVSDARSLGRAVAELLRDPERRRRMAGNAEQVLARNRVKRLRCRT